MATPAKKISQIQLPGETDNYTIVPTMITDSTKTYKATVPGLTKDSTILLAQSYTTKGDILYASSAESPTRLAIGSEGQVLTVSSGVPAWTSPTAVSVKVLNTDNTSAQTPSSSEAIAGSGTVNLHKVSKTGSYNDLNNKPTIPTVNNATLTIQQNSTSVGTFTANASSNVTANIITPQVYRYI